MYTSFFWIESQNQHPMYRTCNVFIRLNGIQSVSINKENSAKLYQFTLIYLQFTFLDIIKISLIDFNPVAIDWAHKRTLLKSMGNVIKILSCLGSYVVKRKIFCVTFILVRLSIKSGKTIQIGQAWILQNSN